MNFWEAEGLEALGNPHLEKRSAKQRAKSTFRKSTFGKSGAKWGLAGLPSGGAKHRLEFIATLLAPPFSKVD